MVTVALCWASLDYARASFDSWVQSLSREYSIAQGKLRFVGSERGSGKGISSQVDGIQSLFLPLT